jgi:hypothetical protein
MTRSSAFGLPRSRKRYLNAKVAKYANYDKISLNLEEVNVLKPDVMT